MADENKNPEEKVEHTAEDDKEEVKDKQQSEESQPEVKSEDTQAEKPKEGEVETSETQEEETTEKEIKEETAKPTEEQEKKTETKEEAEITEKPTEPAEEKKPVEIEPKKESEKPGKKKAEKKDDFQYIIRIANTDIGGEKKVIMGLAQIKGVGRHMAVLIADTAGINREMKTGDLKDAQIEKIKEVLENLHEKAPGWMLNHRKDLDTGDDIHLISADVDMRLRDDINLLKMIRSYRGIRHESGLSVRGQRTRANNRKGLALGVSKKREQV